MFTYLKYRNAWLCTITNIFVYNIDYVEFINECKTRSVEANAQAT